MLMFIQKFRLTIATALLTLFMISLAVVPSFAQKEPEDPPSGYSEDETSQDARFSNGIGCYTTIVMSCPFGLERIFCQFNGVYGPPYSCTWSGCLTTSGDRHCVLVAN